ALHRGGDGILKETLRAEHTRASTASKPAPILRDDRFAIPQDEVSATAGIPEGLMLRDRRHAPIVSKHEAGLTSLTTPTVSFSGLSRESLFGRQGNSLRSPTRTNRDPRHKAEDDSCEEVGQGSGNMRNVIPETPKALSGTYSSALGRGA